MQFTTLVLHAFLALAAAASNGTQHLPSCSAPCLASAAEAFSCGATDYACQCNHQENLVSQATTCIGSSCSVAEIDTTKKAFSALCEGGTATSPSPSAASSGAPSSTGLPASSLGSLASAGSASSTAGGLTSAGGHVQRTGLGWAAVAGLVGYVAL